MSKTIDITYKGDEYTLEYTRASIRQMEAKGFVAADIESKPLTVLPDLFAGAFLAHHKWVKREVIDEIYSQLKDKEVLIAKLSEMYSEPIESLLNEGNLEWKANW